MKNEYVLLTPGPLSTSETVREAMGRDWCTWDDEYLQLVQTIRQQLVRLATKQPSAYTSVLMQGSGTFGVEATIGTIIPRGGRLLVATNGAYGDRIIEMATVLGIDVVVSRTAENEPTNVADIARLLTMDAAITHVIVVHCETTSGLLNPVRDVCEVAKRFGKVTIVDAMSSFAGVEMDVYDWNIDFLISSANKCIEGVPGFSFVIARTDLVAGCKGQARSLSLDLYDQWYVMEHGKGKWRYTSPTHTVRAFHQALIELEAEGGVAARTHRYRTNQQTLVRGMAAAGFRPYIEESLQSPIITSFYEPELFDFATFYYYLKERGFVIYPGKISHEATFRIGSIGHVTPQQMEQLTTHVQHYMTREEVQQ